jgi:hypothetical protein
MSEKTARWTTTLDGIPSDHSGGTDYLRDLSGAHPTHSMTRGARTAGNRSAVHHSQGVRI